MNDSKRTRNIMIGIVAAAVIGTAIAMAYNTSAGVFALLISIVTVTRCFFYLRSIDSDDRRSQSRTKQYDQSRTVYVSLLDAAGVPLDEAAAARLGKARMMAGPRDTVIGVNRQV